MHNDTPDKESAAEVARRALFIATALSVASVKDRAETRRMGEVGSAFFWRMVARLDIAPRDEPPWFVYVRLAAILTPSSATKSFHDPDRPLGAVLADGGNRQKKIERPAISEARLARLLAARGDARLSALERAVRSLSRSTREIDAVSLAWAVMNPAGQQIARAYYRRLDGGLAHSDTTRPEGVDIA